MDFILFNLNVPPVVEPSVFDCGVLAQIPDFTGAICIVSLKLMMFDFGNKHGLNHHNEMAEKLERSAYTRLECSLCLRNRRRRMSR